MPERMRIGIVGCGGIANAHVAGYAANGAKLVAVFDVAQAAAEAMAAKTGAIAAASMEAMIDLQLDAVSICTPPAVHLENCRPFLEAGIPVLCEKPLEVDAGQAQALCRLAERHDETPFMTAFCHRFHPPVIALKKLIDDGVLGEPQLFRNFFGGWGNMTTNHRANRALSGGGCLVDHGCHSMDLFRHLVGDPTHAQAVTANIAQEMNIEDFGIMLLSMGEAAFGEITCTYSLRVTQNAVEWYGTKGTAIISYFDPTHPDLCYRLADSREWITVDCTGKPDRFTAEIAHFLGCVEGDEEPSVSARDGLKANLIAEAVYRSAREGRQAAINS